MVKIFVNINVLTKSSSVYFFFLFVFEFSHLEMHVNHTQIWHLVLSLIVAVINYTIVHSWCHLRVNVSGNSLSLSRNKNIFVFSCYQTALHFYFDFAPSESLKEAFVYHAVHLNVTEIIWYTVFLLQKILQRQQLSHPWCWCLHEGSWSKAYTNILSGICFSAEFICKVSCLKSQSKAIGFFLFRVCSSVF